jgi:hypothetical protein
MCVDMEENLIHCITRNFTICILHHILFRVQVKEMKWEGYLARLGKRETHARYWWGNMKKVGACSTYGGEERCMQGFGGKT